MVDPNKIESKIRAALRKQKNYSADMETAISLTAGSYIAFTVALNDVRDLEKSYIEEITREGNTHTVPHPAFKVLATASESLRKNLRELRLTIASLEGAAENDEVEDVINRVNAVDDEAD